MASLSQDLDGQGVPIRKAGGDMSLKRSNERILGDVDGLAAEFIFITGHTGKKYFHHVHGAPG